MEYLSLLNGVEYTGTPPKGQPTRIVQDSRKVVPGSVFVCLAGRGFDGHDFAPQALAAGAGMIVSQRPLGLPGEVTVPDARAAYAEMSQNFFGRPAQKLRLVAVTGTNGKTTVSSVIKQALEGLGAKCGLIGTIGSEIGEVHIPAKFTTPEAWDMAALMARMVSAGCTHCVMEASSQALAQGRLHGLRFALGIFTNLSLDHLDYHGDMEDYFAAKRSLFFQCDAMLCNLDDAYGRRLLGDPALCAKGGAVAAVRSFSAESAAADFTARGADLRADGVRFGFLGEGFLERVTFPIPGDYSVANALCAGAAVVRLGTPPGKAAAALCAVRGVRGRCEVLHSGDYTVICDFAHTGDAIDKLLCSLRPFVKNRMVVLFGCAGEREATKRLAMGEAAGRWGDLVYLTADNPRREDILKTMTDAEPPLAASGKPYVMEPDREAATVMALSSLEAGDMLVLCSKGHEDYQVMDGYTLYFDERQILHLWQASKGATS